MSRTDDAFKTIKATNDWPREKIRKGDELFVYHQTIRRKGQLLAIRYKSRGFIAKYVQRDRTGIVVQSSNGQELKLWHGEYVIEGVIKRKPKTTSTNPNQEQPPFGTLSLDERGVITSYNPTSEQISQGGFLGKNFFTDVAACSQLRKFDYEAFLRGTGALTETFETADMLITLLRITNGEGAIALCTPAASYSVRAIKRVLRSTGKQIVKELEEAEPKFSIQNGRLRVTT